MKGGWDGETTFKVQLYKGYSVSFPILAFLAKAVLIHTNRRGEGDMMRMELREKWEVITFKLTLSLSFHSA